MRLAPGVLRNQQPGSLLSEPLFGGCVGLRIGNVDLDALGLNDSREGQHAEPGVIHQHHRALGRPDQAGLDLGSDQAGVGEATLRKVAL